MQKIFLKTYELKKVDFNLKTFEFDNLNLIQVFGLIGTDMFQQCCKLQ